MAILDDFDFNRIGQGGGGDLLLSLGTGLLSGRNWREGIGQGFQNARQMAYLGNQRKRQETLDKLAADREARMAAWQDWQRKHEVDREAVTDQRAATNQALQQAQFDFQRQQANKPMLVDVPQADGTVQKQFVSPGGTMGATVGAPVKHINPADKITNEQANAALFSSRMDAANDIISDPEIWKAGVGAAGLGGKIAESVPFVGNYMQSPKYQQLRQAQTDFLNAVLRRESGAAINQGEYDMGNKQYFPQPGDSPDVIAQKEANRKTALEGIVGAASPSFRPKFEAEREARRRAAMERSAKPKMPSWRVVE